MIKPESFTARWIVGNPIYVLSAAVMMYGIALVLNRPGHSPGDVPHILSAFAALPSPTCATGSFSVKTKPPAPISRSCQISRPPMTAFTRILAPMPARFERRPSQRTESQALLLPSF